jgi:ankyrin repeat protein
MIALKHSSTDVAELLMNRQQLDIKVQHKCLEPALLYAIHYGNLSTIKSLELPDLTVDAKHKCGRTVLHSAVFGGKIEAPSLLLERGGDPSLMDNLGHSP